MNDALRFLIDKYNNDYYSVTPSYKKALDHLKNQFNIEENLGLISQEEIDEKFIVEYIRYSIVEGKMPVGLASLMVSKTREEVWTVNLIKRIRRECLSQSIESSTDVIVGYIIDVVLTDHEIKDIKFLGYLYHCPGIGEYAIDQIKKQPRFNNGASIIIEEYKMLDEEDNL